MMDFQPGVTHVNRYDHSEKLFKTAQKLIPGGVNAPMRSYKHVGQAPVFMAGGAGAILQDMDGNQYVDYVCGWGPLILGHTNEAVNEAITNVLAVGTLFGTPTDRETALADLISSLIPSVEMLRLMNSGTEATMTAIRLARAYTGRKNIIRMDGGYHGFGDSLLISPESEYANMCPLKSAGIPQEVSQFTHVVPFNSIDAIEEMLTKLNPESVAAIIVEPVAALGCIKPQEGYFAKMRELCTKHGIVLIADEMVTGFRLGLASGQGMFNIQPDLTCFGKIIGGGMPLAAVGGKKDIMMRLLPEGDVYQAGTLSGNPVSVAAGLATMAQLSHETYGALEAKTQKLTQGMRERLNAKGISHRINTIASMFSIWFGEGDAPTTFAQTRQSNNALWNKFFVQMLEEGVLLTHVPNKSCFVSTALTDEHIEFTLNAMDNALKEL